MLILAGGFGTRLKAVLPDVPKALAPVNEIPFIDHVIDNCALQGVTDIICLLHYEAEKIQKNLSLLIKKKNLSEVRLRSITEDKPLGTGGAIINAIKELNIREQFLVMNADTWLSGGIKDICLMDSPALGVTSVENCERYGSIKIKNGFIEEFVEKNNSFGRNNINAGLYHFSPKDFSQYSSGVTLSLEKEILPNMVKNQSLKGIVLDVSFVDIGIPEDYYKFCRMMENGELD